jgi:16S rRNA (guanine1516-N2)-methyltransferase
MRNERLAGLLGNRLRVECADGRDWLRAHSGSTDAPDAVVIDPMFPQKKKRSALPRKEMVLLREVVGEDIDAADLLAAARACARQRVVLKRGDDALELAAADWCIEGTTVRFDVWRCTESHTQGQSRVTE